MHKAPVTAHDMAVFRQMYRSFERDTRQSEWIGQLYKHIDREKTTSLQPYTKFSQLYKMSSSNVVDSTNNTTPTDVDRKVRSKPATSLMKPTYERARSATRSRPSTPSKPVTPPMKMHLATNNNKATTAEKRPRSAQIGRRVTLPRPASREAAQSPQIVYPASARDSPDSGSERHNKQKQIPPPLKLNTRKPKESQFQELPSTKRAWYPYSDRNPLVSVFERNGYKLTPVMSKEFFDGCSVKGLL